MFDLLQITDTVNKITQQIAGEKKQCTFKSL